MYGVVRIGSIYEIEVGVHIIHVNGNERVRLHVTLLFLELPLSMGL
jgi:hypothetical protein